MLTPVQLITSRAHNAMLIHMGQACPKLRALDAQRSTVHPGAFNLTSVLNQSTKTPTVRQENPMLLFKVVDTNGISSGTPRRNKGKLDKKM